MDKEIIVITPYFRVNCSNFTSKRQSSSKDKWKAVFWNMFNWILCKQLKIYRMMILEYDQNL